MQVAKLSKLLGAHKDTLRRWSTHEYAQFMTPSARPGKGHERTFLERDVAILMYVQTQRDSGASHADITDRLVELRQNEFADLPPVPPEWFQDHDGTMSVVRASEQARGVAELAVLQNEVTHLRDRLADLEQRERAQKADLDALRVSERAATDDVHRLELELAQTQGQVQELRARLQGYTLTAGGDPVPLVLLVAIVAAVTVILLIALLVAVSLTT